MTTGSWIFATSIVVCVTGIMHTWLEGRTK